MKYNCKYCESGLSGYVCIIGNVTCNNCKEYEINNDYSNMKKQYMELKKIWNYELSDIQFKIYTVTIISLGLIGLFILWIL